MKKTALMFPGQGSQMMGMGQDVFNNFEKAREIFEIGSKTIGTDLQKLCFETNDEELSETINSQPAIFAVSAAIFEVLKDKGLLFDGVCGFSLGEIVALSASNIFSVADGFDVISKRAKFMQEASEDADGGMCAVIGLDSEKVEQICQTIDGYVIPVNYNCPKQVVIAGVSSALEKAKDACLASGAMKAVRLKVNAAFHSELMNIASEKFMHSIESTKINKASCDVYSNVSADVLPNDTSIPSYLATQMTSPVRFENVVRKMIADGYQRFIEIGTGKVLSGLIRRIDKTVEVVNISDVASIEKFFA